MKKTTDQVHVLLFIYKLASEFRLRYSNSLSDQKIKGKAGDLSEYFDTTVFTYAHQFFLQPYFVFFSL